LELENFQTGFDRVELKSRRGRVSWEREPGDASFSASTQPAKASTWYSSGTRQGFIETQFFEPFGFISVNEYIYGKVSEIISKYI